jgi:hypothetical protein
MIVSDHADTSCMYVPLEDPTDGPDLLKMVHTVHHASASTDASARIDPALVVTVVGPFSPSLLLRDEIFVNKFYSIKIN